MDTTNYAERNREAWNQVTPIHHQHTELNLQAAVQAADYSDLDVIDKTAYAFPHTLAEIFTAILQNHLTLRAFQEYSHDISLDCKHLEKYQQLPLCYTLVAQKEEIRHESTNRLAKAAPPIMSWDRPRSR